MAVATPVDKIRGMPAELAGKLKEHKILNANQLLEAGCTPEDRKRLSTLLGVETKELLEFLNRADLDRVEGIGAAYANLLEEAGVDTVKELAKRVPEHLHAKLTEINDEKKVTTHPPTLAMVEEWVKEARMLPVMLEY